MRHRILALALLLAACGQPSQGDLKGRDEAPAPAPVPPAAAAAATTVYDLAKFKPDHGGSVTVVEGGLRVVTDPQLGAFSASLRLGESAKQQGVSLRVKFAVEEGRLTMLMSHADSEKDHKPFQQSFPPNGETSVDLPIDRTGAMPVLILSNGRKDNQPTKAKIISVELVPSA